jgi:outer membrane protein assembly factor BamB
MKRTAYFLVFILLLATASMVLAEGDDFGGDDLAYVVSATAQFGVLNTETGDFRLIGTTPSVLSGLARGPQGVLYSLDANNNLITINPVNGTTIFVVVVGNTGLPVQTNGNITLMTSLGKGKLFAVDPNNIVYSINHSTGLATRIGSTGIPVPDFTNCVTGNSLAGAEGHLYFTFIVDNNDPNTCDTPAPSRLYRIDPHTGKATLVGPTGADAPIVGSAFIDDTLFGFTFGGAVNQPTNKILAIDLETGAAEFVVNQGANLDPVFGGVPRFRHRSRREREE